MCLVTVIIPYFKKKKYIQDTINTVVTQTYKNLEIIIIYDDTDMSDLNYLKEIAKSDNRIITVSYTHLRAHET